MARHASYTTAQRTQAQVTRDAPWTFCELSPPQISAHPRKGRYSLASSEQRTEEFQPTVIGQLMMNAIHYATLIDWALDTMHRQ